MPHAPILRWRRSACGMRKARSHGKSSRQCGGISQRNNMDLPHIPAKYKHLIMIAVAAAVESQMCTTVFMRGAKLAGVTKGEIAEAIMVARQARASTIFATAPEGFEAILDEG
mgnify:CR=1 FL=1